MPDVTTMLESDHRKVEELFAQFEGRGDSRIAEQICDELTVHTTVEEEFVYPRLQQIDADGAREAQQEHNEAKDLIARIRATDDGELSTLVRELKQAIEHHVQEEESELFPELRERLGSELEMIGRRVEDRKQELMGRGGRVHGQGQVTDLKALKKDELYRMAQEAGIGGRSQMTKDELVRALQRQS